MKNIKKYNEFINEEYSLIDSFRRIFYKNDIEKTLHMFKEICLGNMDNVNIIYNNSNNITINFKDEQNTIILYIIKRSKNNTPLHGFIKFDDDEKKIEKDVEYANDIALEIKSQFDKNKNFKKEVKPKENIFLNKMKDVHKKYTRSGFSAGPKG